MKKYIYAFLIMSLVLLPALSYGAGPDFEPIGSEGKIKVPVGFIGGPAGATSIGGLILSIINIALLIVGSVSVLFLIIGGFRYVTAEGSEDRAESAKNTMLHSIIGLVIVLLSFVIVRVIANALIKGSPF